MERGQRHLPINEEGRVEIPYFAYGSNLHQEQMKARCPGSEGLSIAVLKDHKLTYRGNWRGNGVANIEPQEHNKVEGAIYTIDQDDLAALDRYEGYPRLYYRDIIEVETPNGTIEAFAYFMHTDQYNPEMPSRIYFNTILNGYQDWGLVGHRLVDHTVAWKNEVQKFKEEQEEELI